MTTNEWLEEILTNEVLMLHWLQKQYCGEVRAYIKITEVSNGAKISNRNKFVLKHIANQELQHSFLIGKLIHNRGVLPSIKYHNTDSRYWKDILPSSFEELMAVGSHAETMRLLRINAICEHPKTPPDIKEVFIHIQKEENWHAKAFAKMSSKISIEKMKESHELGMIALGLEM